MGAEVIGGQMKRLGLVVLAVALGACAQAKPIVFWTCAGCQMLVQSGVCTDITGLRGVAPEALPKCKPGEVVVIENWKDVSRKGAQPVLGCEKEN